MTGPEVPSGATSRPSGAAPTYGTDQRRDIALLALLRGISLVGDSIALVALYLRLAPLGHAWLIAALAIAGSLPLVLLAPLAGWVADRLPAKRVLGALGLVEALICVGIGFWHGTAATLGLMFALTVAVAFSLPGYSALVPFVAGDENVVAAQSLMQSVQGVASVAGPALGGLLVGVIGQSNPLYIDGASFAIGAGLTLWLRHDRRPAPHCATEHSPSEKMTAGVSLLVHDQLLRPLVLNMFVFLLSLGMVNVAEVFFVTQTLHSSALDYGLVGASFGLGLVGGSLLARRLHQDTVRLARTVTISVVVIGVMIGAIGLIPSVGYIYPLLAGAGVAVGIVNVAAMTLFTLRTPEALRGRMFAAVGAIFTGAEVIATAAGGAVLVALAPRTVFQIGGGVATLTALVLGPLALRASVEAHRRELVQGA